MTNLTNKMPWFSFLLHPRDVDDLDRCAASSFLRRYSATDNEYIKKVCMLPPQVIGEISFLHSPIHGELISVARLPEDMTKVGAKSEIVEALRIAVARGARSIGLGGLTGPATAGGMRLLGHLPNGVTLTNGNAFTAFVARANVNQARDALGSRRNVRVALIGCTGSVGVPLTHLLKSAGYKLILIGRTTRRVTHKFSNLPKGAVFSDQLSAAKDAEIVVLLTNDPSAKLKVDDVAKGAIIIDCAQPANVPSSARRRFLPTGAIVVEGGIVNIPNFTSSFDFGLRDPRECFACLAETYLFAREGIREHSVGVPTPEFAERIGSIGRRHDVAPRRLNLQPRDDFYGIPKPERA